MALVEHFYRHLADGYDEGSALQQAKLELIKEFGREAVPFYWAGFNLVGNASAAVLSLAR
jgi:CHAT domain-containing protein